MNLIFRINTTADDAGEMLGLVNKLEWRLEVLNLGVTIKKTMVSSRKKRNEPHTLTVGERAVRGVEQIEALLSDMRLNPYWLTAEQASVEVRKWPTWKRGDYSHLKLPEAT